ncbi:MAG: polysaccharide deacetylase family protein [Chloroflexota bacterium]
MNLRLRFLLTLALGLAACRASSAAPATVTASLMPETLLPARSITPAPTATPTITSTATRTDTPLPIPSPSPAASSTPSATLRPEFAPTLAPVEAGLITNGSRQQPYVALTFDLCQKPEYPAGFDQGIFEALVAASAPATFFVGGDWARTHPDETRLLASVAYFELGNHSWSHPDLPGLSRPELDQEILKTQQILYELTGEQPRLFRLPAGLYNNAVLRVIAAHGLYTIQWDVVTADPVPDNQADNINRIVRENAQNGSIIIMHANGRGWHTAEALPAMIKYLRGQGYRLVTVSQLLGLEPIE